MYFPLCVFLIAFCFILLSFDTITPSHLAHTKDISAKCCVPIYRAHLKYHHANDNCSSLRCITTLCQSCFDVHEQFACAALTKIVSAFQSIYDEIVPFSYIYRHLLNFFFLSLFVDFTICRNNCLLSNDENVNKWDFCRNQLSTLSVSHFPCRFSWQQYLGCKTISIPRISKSTTVPFCPGVFQFKHIYHLFVFLIGDLYFFFFSYHEKFDRFELTHAIIPRPYVCIHIEIHINHHKRIRCLCTPRRMAHNYFSNERIRAYFALLSVFFPSNAILFFWQDLFKQNGDRNLKSIWAQAICHIYCFECLTHRETHVWFFFWLLFRIHYNFGLIGICVFEGSMRRLNRFLSNSN